MCTTSFPATNTRPSSSTSPPACPAALYNKRKKPCINYSKIRSPKKAPTRRSNRPNGQPLPRQGPRSKGGLIPFFAGLMRMRAAQITAVAALLLTLVQVGQNGDGRRRRISSQSADSQLTSAPPPMQGWRYPGNEGTIASGSKFQTREAGSGSGSQDSPRPDQYACSKAKLGESKDAISSAAGGELKKELGDKLQPRRRRPRPLRAEDPSARKATGPTYEVGPGTTKMEIPATPRADQLRGFAQADPQRAARSSSSSITKRRCSA